MPTESATPAVAPEEKGSTPPASAPAGLSAESRELYREVLLTLADAGVSVLVGGAYAFGRYTGIARHTKDLDLFVHPRELPRVASTLESAGFRVELYSPHWLMKATRPDREEFIDLIFGSGNGLCAVDDAWFEHARDDRLLGLDVRLVPPEELLWGKSFIMERERFDGADVQHLLQALAGELDWERLLARFGEHWRVLLAHLVLFGYVYPGERSRLPSGVVGELLQRAGEEGGGEGGARGGAEDGAPLCRGPLLSRAQYLVDVEERGYRDARELGEVEMDGEDIEAWTERIPEEDRPAEGGGA